MNRDARILIVGGGIAGLALAGLLERKGFSHIVLIEKQKTWKTLGFGINLWGLGRRILAHLGIEHEVTREGYVIPDAKLANELGETLSYTPFGQYSQYGGDAVVVERDILHRELVSTLKKTQVRLNTTISSLTRTNAHSVVFSDGRTGEFDLVVGADGIHSQVRDAVFGENLHERMGWSVGMTYLPKSYAYPKDAIWLSAERNVLAFFPMRDKCFVGLYFYDPEHTGDVETYDISHFTSYLKNLGWTSSQIEHLPSLVGGITGLAKVNTNAWSQENVVLIGDAKHALSPTLGLGCSLALEDAFVLSEELARHPIEEAIRKYVLRRKRRIAYASRLENLSDSFLLITRKSSKKIRDVLAKLLPPRLMGILMKRLMSWNI